MKKIILTMFAISVLSIVTTAFASDDISGEYTFRDTNHKSFVGAVTIKLSGNNVYDVIAYTQDISRTSFFSRFEGKGKVVDGVLIVKCNEKTRDGKDNILRIHIEKGQGQVMIKEDAEQYDEGASGGVGLEGVYTKKGAKTSKKRDTTRARAL